MERNRTLVLAVFILFVLSSVCWAEKEFFKTIETGQEETTATATSDIATTSSENPAVTAPVPAVAIPEQNSKPNEAITSETTQTQPPPILVKAETTLPNDTYTDPTKYTLGPDDIIQIDVQRHIEFSGIFPVNLEGKIQYKFVGDVEVNGLTKKGVEEKLKKTLSTFIIDPEISVTILEYKSKVIYVLGEVGTPGKYYMRSEAIPVREAVVQAGLPTYAAAMRRCRLITPDKNGKAKIKDLDLYSLLYGGDLSKNMEMHAGDVLYVPATVMAKMVRVINPVTSAVGVSSSGPEQASRANTAIKTLGR